MRPFFHTAALLVLVSLSACNKNEPPKEPRGDKPTGNDRNQADGADVYALAADDFTKEFVGVDAGRKGNLKYKGKKLELTGVVWRVRGCETRGLPPGPPQVGVDPDKLVCVYLQPEPYTNTPRTQIFVQCSLLPEYHAKGQYLSAKQKVKISGEFLHFSGGGGGWDDLLEWGLAINLEKCSLKELSESETIQISAPDLVKAFATDRAGAEKKYADQELIVSGQIEDFTVDAGINFYAANLKGDGKTRVSVRLSPYECILLRDKKLRDVSLRGTFKVSTSRDHEIFLHAGFIVKADERK